MITTDESTALSVPTIATATGYMKLSRLRPGCWLRSKDGATMVLVTINSAKMQRACLSWEGITKETPWGYNHMAIAEFTFVGHGKRRWWFRLLPKFLRIGTSPYSKP